MGLLQEFKTFALKGNVVDMAVGVIIGGAFGKIVTSLVNDVIMPPLGMLIGKVNFTDLALNLGSEAEPVMWKYGAFLQQVFDFLIVALCIFFLIKGINRLSDLTKKKEAEEAAAAQPAPAPAPEPIAPVEPKEEIPYKPCAVSFYGTMVSVGFPTNETFKLAGLSEKQLAKSWKQLANEAYDITLSNVLAIRKNLALCDWGYVELLQAVSEKKYGKTNEAVFMQAYLLSQSGYKIRMATDDNRLYLLVATQHNMLGISYFILDNTKFYALNCDSKELSICKASFDQEKSLSLQLRQEQKLDTEMTAPRKLTSKYGVTAQVAVNKNMIDFFNDYPSAYIGNDIMTRWAVYANTPLDKSIKTTLYPTLKKSIEGLSERDAVNKILNFVQTAFVYEYDDKIWGSDRAFFAAETLHYPYADCEDRSILFSRLVRDILGLDVVLLYYPGHLATAVAFTQDVNGDYLTYKNRKYIICDPTYIGAPLGRTMPGMNNQEAQVIVL